LNRTAAIVVAVFISDVAQGQGREFRLQAEYHANNAFRLKAELQTVR